MKKFPPPRFQTGPLNHCNSLSGNLDNPQLQMSARFPRSSGGSTEDGGSVSPTEKLGTTLATSNLSGQRGALILRAGSRMKKDAESALLSAIGAVSSTAHPMLSLTRIAFGAVLAQPHSL